MREASNKKANEQSSARIDKLELLLDETKEMLSTVKADLAAAKVHIEECDKDREELRSRVSNLENK
jgi:chromosome segregation ATPase